MSEILKTLPVWHEGETYIQQKVGVAERMAAVGQRVIRDFMPDQHRDFYAQLPFIVLGSVDGRGDAWATFLEGRPGFMSSPSTTILNIAARRDASDPASEGMADGQPIGLLGMEMHTRRRNRMNGFVSTHPTGFSVDVDQSFGNCPRYIQLRDFEFVRDPGRRFLPARVEDLPAPRWCCTRHDRGGRRIFRRLLCRSRRSTPGRRVASRRQGRLRSCCGRWHADHPGLRRQPLLFNARQYPAERQGRACLRRLREWRHAADDR